jgi:carbon storage regulator
MLVVTRKAGESIVIGDKIIITVVAVEGDRVRIGVEAPKEVTILRQELYEAVGQENRAAAGTGPDVLAQMPRLAISMEE